MRAFCGSDESDEDAQSMTESDEDAQSMVSEGIETEQEVWTNFRWMAICFAVNHSCATAPIIFASSVLDPAVGYLGNGVLYLVSVVSSLLLSVVTVDRLGLKGGLILGTIFYAIYVGCFTLASLYTKDVSLQYPLFVSGSAACGLAAGILWTAQGGYMAQSATMLADLGAKREDATAELAAAFAFYYLVLEVIGKLGFTFLQHGGLEVFHIGLLYTILAVLSMLLLCRISDLSTTVSGEAGAPSRSVFSKLFATMRLWKDPKIWLLSPTNITFGFSAAYLNGYFNAVYEVPELGVKSLGLLGALTVSCAAVFAKVYGCLGAKFGKGVPITAGAVSFACIPIIVLNTNCCKGFGWSMVIFYILQGSGRAVFESTNKAVFSDFFTGEDTEGAFANCAMQMSVASAVLFFNSGRIPGSSLAYMVMVSAILTPVVYLILSAMKASSPSEGDDNDEDQPMMGGASSPKE